MSNDRVYMGSVTAARGMGLAEEKAKMASDIADIRMLMLEGKSMAEACDEIGMSTSAYREHRTRLSDPWRVAATIYESRARDMMLDRLIGEVCRLFDEGTSSERLRMVDRLIPALLQRDQGQQVNVAVMPAVMERYPHVTREQAMRVLRDDIGTRQPVVVEMEVDDLDDG